MNVKLPHRNKNRLYMRQVPVSYTHLDVYKRQVRALLGELFCIKKQVRKTGKRKEKTGKKRTRTEIRNKAPWSSG